VYELCIEILDCSLTVPHLTSDDHWRRYHKGRLYAAPASLGLNQWVLSGDWTIGNQATILNEANGRIAITPAIFISSWDRQRRALPTALMSRTTVW
jgi:hypothetical protein